MIFTYILYALITDYMRTRTGADQVLILLYDKNTIQWRVYARSYYNEEKSM